MSAKRKYPTDKELEELVDQSNEDDEDYFCFINTRRVIIALDILPRPYSGRHPIASYLDERITGSKTSPFFRDIYVKTSPMRRG